MASITNTANGAGGNALAHSLHSPRPSRDLVASLVSYDPETGKFFWKLRPAAVFASARAAKTWNAKYPNREALRNIDREGYLFGFLLNRAQRAHRVAWLLITGEWPESFIDHIDGDRANNRAVNLRAATVKTNMRNNRIYASNTSGFGGVSWCENRGKWRAYIKVDGRQECLGAHTTMAEAIQARKAANAKYGFSERHGAPTAGARP